MFIVSLSLMIDNAKVRKIIMQTKFLGNYSGIIFKVLKCKM